MRKKIWIGERRVWNLKMNWRKNNSDKDQSRLPYLISYLFDETKMKNLLKYQVPNMILLLRLQKQKMFI